MQMGASDVPSGDDEVRAAKLDQLRKAVEAYEAGEGPTLFDHAAEEAKAEVRNRALRLLDQRARSREELNSRLTALEFEPRVIAEVLDDLESARLIDDREFAREWVRQRHQRRGKSARVLDRELSQKGVSATVRAEALEQIDAADEEAMARQLAAKKARSIKTAPADRTERDKQLRRIVGVLARRGFPEGMALRVAREALKERLQELEL